MITQDLIDYYKNLLIIQYFNRTKARGTVNTFVKEIVADQIVQQAEDAFDLNTAIGAQLDILGTYRGANRLVFGINLGKNFFAMPPYNDLSPTSYKGFALYSDAPNVGWYFELYSDASTHSVLTDPDFRQFIQFLARFQSMYLGLGELDNLLYDFMGNYLTLDDNLDMTITYTDDPGDPNNLFKILEYTNSLPQPAGVTVQIT